jgi:hypothetical protein
MEFQSELPQILGETLIALLDTKKVSPFEAESHLIAWGIRGVKVVNISNSISPISRDC